MIHIEMRNGVYYVPETKISLDSIVYSWLDGASPESIREDFPKLSLAQVYGAISFFLDHREEVNQYLKRREAEWEELGRNGKAPSPDLADRFARARHGIATGRR